jgi:hypothetical protein
MKSKVQFKYGEANYVFEIEESADIDTLHKTIALGNPPRECNLIKDGKYSLQTNKDTQGNTYINAVCVGFVGKEFKVAKAKLGLYKSKGFFWHNWEFNEWGAKQAPADEEDTTKKFDKDYEGIPV